MWASMSVQKATIVDIRIGPMGEIDNIQYADSDGEYAAGQESFTTNITYNSSGDITALSKYDDGDSLVSPTFSML